MNDLLVRLLGATLGLSLSALAVQGLVFVLRPSSPRVQQVAWFLVLFQGIVLFHFPVRLPWHEPGAERETPVEQTGAVEPGGVASLASEGLATVSERVDSEEAGSLAAPSVIEAKPAIAAAQGARGLPWPQIAGAIWLGGMVLLVAFSGFTYLQFLRQVSRGQPGHEPWVDQWQRLLEERGVSRSIPLVVTEGVGPAMCWTPRGYRVCVPCLSWARLTPGQRMAILRHELAHFERSDLWSILLARLLVLPHWFNPLAWWAARQFAQGAEWACDQTAAGAQRRETLEYAKALLDLGVARSLGPCGARPAQGSSLFVRIRRLTRFTSSEDSIVKKASLLGLAAGLVVLNLVRIELIAKEPDGNGTERAVESSAAETRQRSGPGTDAAASEPSRLSTRFHDVSDLVQSKNEVAELCREIQASVAQARWQNAGGGTIAPTATNLAICVSQDEQTHQQIAEFLATKRQGATGYRIRMLFITTSPETLDQAGVKWSVLSSDFPTDSADRGLTPPLRPLGSSQEPPQNWSRLVVEKIQPVMLEIVDEDRGAKFLEQWNKERTTNVLQAPGVRVLSGQSATVSDVSQTPFVVGLKDSQPQIRIVSEGTVLQLRPQAERQGKRQLDYGKLRLDYVVTFSRIRNVETFTFNRDSENKSGTTLQVPEVETTRLQSTVELPLRSWLLLRGPQRKVEAAPRSSWRDWLAFAGVPRNSDREKREELLVMVHVERVAFGGTTNPDGSGGAGHNDSAAIPRPRTPAFHDAIPTEKRADGSLTLPSKP